MAKVHLVKAGRFYVSYSSYIVAYEVRQECVNQAHQRYQYKQLHIVCVSFLQIMLFLMFLCVGKKKRVRPTADSCVFCLLSGGNPVVTRDGSYATAVCRHNKRLPCGIFVNNFVLV